ncbi:MAG: hypothetical protein HY336_00620 [Candidatus Doudnabacteria bacterium]|nr:hypothetical protein [Candidatus Doudnabacteria bacterium]
METQPKFDFEKLPQSEIPLPPYVLKWPEDERQEYIDAMREGRGWCGQCSSARGKGNCSACLTEKRKRGES